MGYVTLIALILTVFLFVLYRVDAYKDGTAAKAFNELVENGVTVLVSIFCSILASIITGLKEKNDLRDNLEKISGKIYEEKIEDSVRRISKEVTEIYQNAVDMMPLRYYRSADSPNKEFNTFLESSITAGRKFVYYGVSARFTCKRLYRLKDEMHAFRNLSIEIYIVDPVCEATYENNKDFLITKEMNKNPGSQVEFQKIIKQEKMKSLYCLYALMEINNFCYQTDIYLIRDVPFIDIEMTDNMIVLEFFRTSNDYKRYPFTLIYDDKSVYYESYKSYLDWEKGKAQHIKRDDLTVDFILELGKKAGIEVTEEILRDCCNQEIFKEAENYI